MLFGKKKNTPKPIEEIEKQKKEKVEEIQNINNKIGVTYVATTKSIEENIKVLETLFTDCDDFVKRKLKLGKDSDIVAYIIYADLLVDRTLIEESIIKPLLLATREKTTKNFKDRQEAFDYLLNNGLATADVKTDNNIENAVNAVMSGDTVILVEGVSNFISIQTRGWPNRGIQAADTELTLKGSKESFTETLRMNTVLIRRRIRDTNLKIKQMQVGRRSKTDIAVLYMDDVVRKDILSEVVNKLDEIDADAILDSSYLEEFFEKRWTLFPKIQSTERPDKAASAILEGRIVLIVDNSPYIAILPVTLNTLFQSSDDYYQSVWLASFLRIIRYIAAFINLTLPGLYIALTMYHPAMIPTSLTIAIAKSREGVPFPAFLEVIMMEIMFELLREGGIRLPQPIGNTIGIVGALIIGQAAVEASLVSPIIIIVVAITAVASFAIPNTDLAASLRLVKYFIILCATIMGAYGLVLGLLMVTIYLVGMESFGIPYLSPFISVLSQGDDDGMDSVVRFPLTSMKSRPVFSNREEKIRIKEKKDENKKQ